MTRNMAVRVLALLLTTLLFGGLIGGPDLNYVGVVIAWGLSAILLGNLFVALWGTIRRHYPSGGDL
ncbi:hypothetical protein SAMN05443247_00704 [Bradyrhizobium erythrophlei]|jgi:hypothetical protein|nr:hypothetical protein SAMN05443247_00704 [Bradyrhizobium erythrophlei]